MGRLNRARAAAILVDAAYLGDEAAAAKWGITWRTIVNYRNRLATDPLLFHEFSTLKEKHENQWSEQAARALRSAAEFLERAATLADPRDPTAIHAVAGAVKILNEAIMVRKLVDARLAQLAPTHGSAPAPVVALPSGRKHA